GQGRRALSRLRPRPGGARRGSGAHQANRGGASGCRSVFGPRRPAAHAVSGGRYFCPDFPPASRGPGARVAAVVGRSSEGVWFPPARNGPGVGQPPPGCRFSPPGGSRPGPAGERGAEELAPLEGVLGSFPRRPWKREVRPSSCFLPATPFVSWGN